MPKFEVTLTEEVWHKIVVEAATMDVAASMAWKELETNGKDNFNSDDSEWNEYANIEELENEEAYTDV